MGGCLNQCLILSGPAKLPSTVIRFVCGLMVFCPVSEYVRASSAELSIITPAMNWYRLLGPRTLLPNLPACAKGEAAPLFCEPFTRKPSLARWFNSAVSCALNALLAALSAGGAAFVAGAAAFALTSVRWKLFCPLAGAAAAADFDGFFPAGGTGTAVFVGVSAAGGV